MPEERVPTGAAARRERNRQEMIESIVTTAEEIVAREGTDGLTIRKVAGELGYSPGALYEYFDSKEAILGALYFQGTGGLDNCCIDLLHTHSSNASAIEIIADLGRTYRSYALDHAEIYRLAFCEMKAPRTVAETASPDDLTGSFGILLETAKRGIREGSIVDLPAIEIAYAAWSAVHGFVLLEISGHLTGAEMPGTPVASPEESRQQRDRMFETLLHVILNGFAAKVQQPASSS